MRNHTSILDNVIWPDCVMSELQKEEQYNKEGSRSQEQVNDDHRSQLNELQSFQ